MKKLERIMIIVAAAGAVAAGAYVEAVVLLLLYFGCKALEKRLVTRADALIEERAEKEDGSGWRYAAASGAPARLERFLLSFQKIFTPAAGVAGILVAVILSYLTGNREYWIRTGCAFLVLGCLGTLLASVSLAMRSGIALASRRGIFYKDGRVMEKINSIKLLALAQRGVLTDGQYGLQRVIPAIAFEEEEDAGEQAGETEKELVLRLCAAAAAGSSLPAAEGILRAAEAWKLQPEQPEEITESTEEGVCVRLTEGVVCIGSREFLDRHGIRTPELRPLYGLQIPVALDGEHIGTVIVADRLAAGSESLIKEMRHIGVRTVILTDESEFNATAVADNLEIHMVRAGVPAAQQQGALKELQKKNGSTFYVGTGKKDAALLEVADVSCVPAEAEAASAEQADVLYRGTGLEPVEESIDLAFAATRIASENTFLSFLIIAGIVFLSLTGYGNLLMAVVADIGVALICIINTTRLLYFGKYRFRSPGK